MQKNKKYLITVLTATFLLISMGLTVKLLINSTNRHALYRADIMTNNTQQSVEPQDIASQEASNSEVVDKKPEIVKYSVKTGDTIDSISKEYGITVGTIAESNGISQNDIIKEGQELRFPSLKGLLYKIKSGETLWDIASTYNVDIDDISSLNDLDSPDKLKIGQEIIIPGVDKLKTMIANSKPDIIKSISSVAAVKVSSRGSTTINTASKSTGLTGSMWPLRGVITSRFGPRWGTFHKGIDIAAPTGTDISAFMSGTVAFSGWEGGYGKLVIIDHGNGLQSYYGHNSKLIVSAGQYVNKGQHISDVGSTGDSTGPHCHFEIRKNGVSVNPLNYLN